MYKEEYKDLINEIIDVGKNLYNKNFVAGNDGNISTRLTKDQILITCTGISKGRIREEDIVHMDISGRIISGNKKPSSEYKMHLKIYELRPDVCGIIHAHPPKATAFAVAGISIDYVSLPEVILSLGNIAFAEYGTPTTDELPKNVAKVISESDTIILQNHGAVAVGKSVMDAYFKMETLEHTCAVSLYARFLGGEKMFDKKETDRLFQIRKDVLGKEPPSCVNCGACNRVEAKNQVNALPNLDNDKTILDKIGNDEMKRYISEIVRDTLLDTEKIL